MSSNEVNKKRILDFLKSRGINSKQKYVDILRPDKNLIHDPNLIEYSVNFVDKLHQAITESYDIVIVGDYDADGVLSATVQNKALQMIDKQYYDKHVHIFNPSREYGYGLSSEVIDRIITENTFNSKNILLILSDNGISTFEAYDYINDINQNNKDDYHFEVITSDHHKQLKTYEEYIKEKYNVDKLDMMPIVVDINSKTDKYPFKGLSGTGVIYKLFLLYAQKYCDDIVYRKMFAELTVYVGLSAITDIMPVIDENRFYINYALNYMNETSDEFWSYFKDEIIQRDFDFDDFGWLIGPMLNSSSRMLQSSRKSFDALNTNDKDEVADKLSELARLNDERKTKVEEILNSYKTRTKLTPFTAVSVVESTSGMLGIIASKLVNRNQTPAVALSFNKTTHLFNGSARSYKDLDLTEVFRKINDEDPLIISNFGGHAGAVGISVFENKISKFQKLFDEIVSKHKYNNEEKYDFDYDASVDLEFIDLFDRLKPFGTDFEEPIFKLHLDNTKQEIYDIKYMGKNQQHVKIILNNGMNLIMWYGSSFINNLGLRKSNDEINFYGTISVNEFRGEKSLQFIIDSIEK